MSGSGGYYKYRCKYWLTHNCPNWVWVNNAPCAHCLVSCHIEDYRAIAELIRSRLTVETRTLQWSLAHLVERKKYMCLILKMDLSITLPGRRSSQLTAWLHGL